MAQQPEKVLRNKPLDFKTKHEVVMRAQHEQVNRTMQEINNNFATFTPSRFYVDAVNFEIQSYWK